MVPFCVIGNFLAVNDLKINMAHEQTQATYRGFRVSRRAYGGEYSGWAASTLAPCVFDAFTCIIYKVR